ncbi:hypothetical protein F2Q70_00021074 [Brassica cretica]|uniref:Uncharacterized protein n=1 Tax=Brassica cretica TaxID=69181 RepID=A0A8S9GTW4_BRACR|nr:hypothetical protein F2Q70_00021074 [Brassica cretica]
MGGTYAELIGSLEAHEKKFFPEGEEEEDSEGAFHARQPWKLQATSTERQNSVDSKKKNEEATRGVVQKAKLKNLVIKEGTNQKKENLCEKERNARKVHGKEKMNQELNHKGFNFRRIEKTDKNKASFKPMQKLGNQINEDANKTYGKEKNHELTININRFQVLETTDNTKSKINHEPGVEHNKRFSKERGSFEIGESSAAKMKTGHQYFISKHLQKPISMEIEAKQNEEMSVQEGVKKSQTKETQAVKIQSMNDCKKLSVPVSYANVVKRGFLGG